jgi:hypothetical protein
MSPNADESVEGQSGLQKVVNFWGTSLCICQVKKQKLLRVTMNLAKQRKLTPDRDLFISTNFQLKQLPTEINFDKKSQQIYFKY